jgi:hypothetical protein
MARSPPFFNLELIVCVKCYPVEDERLTGCHVSGIISIPEIGVRHTRLYVSAVSLQ